MAREKNGRYGGAAKRDERQIKENFSDLAGALARTGSRELIESFLYCLLTPAEVADIAIRWALVKDLERGIPQREIAKNLGISLCKITRGSRELKKPDSAFRRILETGGS
ncbi:MAG: trp operon repressor [Treponema sp.]|jgi:TrpR family trp operon transcriptional repressor|nr:trp operon repressor [Treponema sp.]